MARKLELIEAKQKAARFCAFQERSPKEVTDKLKSWKLPPEQIDEVLVDLLAEGFVDSQRFANAYCNDKFEFNSWGKQKIKANIYTHLLDSAIVENALDSIDEKKYRERLINLAEKKWGALEGEDEAKRKQKVLAYLTNKGFESDLIWTAIRQLTSK